MPKGCLYDSHCHLVYREYTLKTEDIVDNAINNKVELLLNVGTDLKSSKECIVIDRQFLGKVRSFIGIDPQEVIPNPESFMGLNLKEAELENLKQSLEELILEGKNTIIGIGETGLDFYWIKELNIRDRERSIFLQTKLFEFHIELAEKYKLPLTIHSRGAESECLNMLKTNTKETKGIFHSFTGNYDQARGILDSGNGLGVNGIVTFKNAQNLREVYKKILGKVPANSDPDYFYSKGIFFETDSPFLSPEGKRGLVNYPLNTYDIFKFFVRYLSE